MTLNAQAVRKALRQSVKRTLGEGEEVIVNQCRSEAEEELGLDEGLLKNDAKWKPFSKAIIVEAADEFDKAEDDADESVSEDERPVKRAKHAEQVRLAKRVKGAKKVSEDSGESSVSEDERPAKRTKRTEQVSEDSAYSSVSEDERPAERTKRAEEASEDSADSPMSEDERPAKSMKRTKQVSERPAKRMKRTEQVSVDSDTASQESSAEDVQAAPNVKSKVSGDQKAQGVNRTTKRRVADDENSSDSESQTAISSKASADPAPIPLDDDSDMSIVHDELPKKKKQRQKKDTTGKAKKAATTTKSSTNAKQLSPDEELIKTLQSQLKQCGVNKLWHRELASYNTPKDKIRHLKSMLHDVGMTGRFSAEKANTIKETRELNADLEATKEFARSFGAEASGRARRARPTGKKAYVVDDLDSGNSEEDPALKRPIASGLVDFGDSGDDGSD